MLWVERTLAFEVLPKLYDDVRSQALAGVVAAHLSETKEHAARVEQVFRSADAEPSSNLSAPVEKLAEHHDELAKQIADERLADAFHAAAAVTTEQHELAAYDALLLLARTLGLADARELLERNRNEDAHARDELERELDRLLRELER